MMCSRRNAPCLDRCAGTNRARQAASPSLRPLPEHGHGAQVGPALHQQRHLRNFQQPRGAVERCYPHALVGRLPLVESFRQRQVVRAQRLPVRCRSAEDRRQVLQGHLARLIEAPAQQLLRRLVVVQQLALLPGDPDGHRHVACPPAQQDDLDRLLFRHGVTDMAPSKLGWTTTAPYIPLLMWCSSGAVLQWYMNTPGKLAVQSNLRDAPGAMVM